MTLFLLILLAYLLGSIPTSLWIGQYFFHTDIRQHGSGNLGSTNAFRVFGVKAGSVVLIIDIIKGTIPTVLALALLPQTPAIYIGIFAIIGHTFPLFANFKGGKAVATTTGVLIATYPTIMLFAMIVFAITLYFSRMVSFSSMLSSLSTIILTLFFNDMTLFTIILSLGLFIIYRHRSNIERILNGTENKVPFGYGYRK